MCIRDSTTTAPPQAASHPGACRPSRTPRSPPDDPAQLGHTREPGSTNLSHETNMDHHALLRIAAMVISDDRSATAGSACMSVPLAFAILLGVAVSSATVSSTGCDVSSTSSSALVCGISGDGIYLFRNLIPHRVLSLREKGGIDKLTCTRS